MHLSAAVIGGIMSAAAECIGRLQAVVDELKTEGTPTPSHMPHRPVADQFLDAFIDRRPFS